MSLPIALQRKDAIIVPLHKVNSLFLWRDNNKELVRSFTPILEDVVIQVTNISVHVDKSTNPEYSYQFTVYDGETKVLVQDWNRYNGYVNPIYNKLPKDIIKSDEAAKDYAQSVISIYCTLMAYMEHYTEVVTKQAATVKKTKDRKKKGGKKKQVTYLRRTVYTVSGEINTNRELDKKRGYTAPTEPFKVHGHFRTYKNGKRVWIEGYVKSKKEGKEPEPKKYQL